MPLPTSTAMPAGESIGAEPAHEGVHHDGRALRRGSRVPLTREAIEVALDLVAQFAGPATCMEPGRSPCGDAHRVIRTTRTGGLMTFDC